MTLELPERWHLLLKFPPPPPKDPYSYRPLPVSLGRCMNAPQADRLFRQGQRRSLIGTLVLFIAVFQSPSARASLSRPSRTKTSGDFLRVSLPQLTTFFFYDSARCCRRWCLALALDPAGRIHRALPGIERFLDLLGGTVASAEPARLASGARCQ